MRSSFIPLFLLLLSLSSGCVAAPGAKPDANSESMGSSNALSVEPDLIVTAGASGVSISWLPPSPDADPTKNIVAFQVYRKEWPDPKDPTKVSTHRMIELPGPFASPRVSYTDATTQVGARYEYYLFPVLENKKLGPKRLIGPFDLILPVETVSGLAATCDNGEVRLAWKLATTVPPTPEATQGPVPTTIPEGAPSSNPSAETPPAASDLFINIYRAEGKEGPFSAHPINAQPLQTTVFSDTNVSQKTFYRYKLRVIRSINGILFEGSFSPEAAILAEDNTPPPSPAILWIKAIDSGVRLQWQVVEDKGLLGYYVERKNPDQPSTEFKPVSGLLTVDEFTDHSVKENHGTFVYRVVARDKNGNPGYSNELEVQYPEIPATEPAAAEGQLGAPTAAPVSPETATQPTPEPISEGALPVAPAVAPAVVPPSDKKGTPSGGPSDPGKHQ